MVIQCDTLHVWHWALGITKRGPCGTPWDARVHWGHGPGLTGFGSWAPQQGPQLPQSPQTSRSKGNSHGKQEKTETLRIGSIPSFEKNMFQFVFFSLNCEYHGDLLKTHSFVPEVPNKGWSKCIKVPELHATLLRPGCDATSSSFDKIWQFWTNYCISNDHKKLPLRSLKQIFLFFLGHFMYIISIYKL